MDPILAGFVGAVIGGVISGLGSWFGSKYATKKNIDEQKSIQKKVVIDSAKIALIDFSHAIAEGTRVLKKKPLPGIGITPVGLSFYTNFSKLIIDIQDIIGPMNTSLLFRFYGIAEKIKNDILKYNSTKDTGTYIEYGYLNMFGEIFGENYKKIIDKEGKIDSDYYINMMQKNYKELRHKLLEITLIKV